MPCSDGKGEAVMETETMANVIPLLGLRLVAPPTPYSHFVHTRQEMVRALSNWLATHPGDDAARAEIEGTIALMDQLRRLEAAHG